MMARSRSAAPAARGRRAGEVAASSGLTESAERMIGQLERLVAEVVALRDDNEALQKELRAAVALLDRASASLGGAGVPARRRSRPAADAVAAGAARPVAARKRSAASGRGRGRVTPGSVTPDAVRAAIGGRGSATAREIAEDIGKLVGQPVSGRAIRFLAERAGATSDVVDGVRRYRLP